MTLRKGTFEEILRKEENADKQYFLLFPQCFLPFNFSATLMFSSANALDLDYSKNLLSGKELNPLPDDKL